MNLSNQPIRAVSKPSHARNKPKRAARGKFSAKTINTIVERDKASCVRCGSPYIESVPHHIIYKSQGGLGTVDNGVCVCRPCHTEAHSKREVRQWFEQYRINHLLDAN
ncbi:HNH endonuclease [Paenibacillus sp. BIHB 4019]|uniref:HNH endonuclease n=1 Tax=Paenibacillus sp. BIHB 4019 TaxID=1870819 RepID=UPI000C1530CC|nr:HNH endonuclease [Paenibacillus sp. BIHB 4019]